MGLGLRRASRVLTVSELAARIKGTLETGLGAVLVAGELSGVRRTGPGTIWFCLKDDGAQLDGVMFRGDALGLMFEPVDGIQVVVSGRVSIWPERGRLQVYAKHMEPLGVGALGLAFEHRYTGNVELAASLAAAGVAATGKGLAWTAR